MTDKDALLRCVIESPQDDTPRLIYADWLEQNDGEHAEMTFVEDGEEVIRVVHPRAEFIRVQCELSRPIGQEYVNVEEIRDLRRRERELLHQFEDEWFPLRETIWKENERNWNGLMPVAEWSRGFISSITCDWETFRRHAPALVWHPEDKVECPALICRGCSKPILKDNGGVCDGCPCNSPRGINHGLVPVAVCTCHECQPPTEDGGGYSRGNGLNLHAGCVRCKGTGKVRRPFPPTAQPIETARLTTWPVGRDYFARMKCPTCEGWRQFRRAVMPTMPSIRQMLEPPSVISPAFRDEPMPCPQCHGTPPNRWTCDSYRGVVFSMPEADRTDRLDAIRYARMSRDEYRHHYGDVPAGTRPR